ncbi:MAG: hypothetical protein HQM09_14685 [Candidatus Riflebacteria bacterium]|nr:hypothetical protein [Candidatus Riflebacteria bacterium]
MNSFKASRKEFIRKYFHFPDELEKAIRVSKPASYCMIPSGESLLNRLTKYDKPERLIELLDKYGFNQSFNWSYVFLKSLYICDWCSIYWTENGLWIHFEWQQISSMKDFRLDIDMDDEAWNFLYSRRKTILSNFCGGSLIKHFKEEEFAELLITKGPS